MKLLTVYDAPKSEYGQQIEYTFNTILQTLGLTAQIFSLRDAKQNHILARLQESVLVSYGKQRLACENAHFHIHIYMSPLFGVNYLMPTSLPELPLHRYSALPVIYKGTGPLETLVRQRERSIETNIDLIASVFFMLTRYEEFILGFKEAGRFDHQQTVAYKEGFLDVPIVNEYTALLRNWLEKGGIKTTKSYLWKGRQFAACITHDIDKIIATDLESVTRSIGRHVLKRHGLNHAMVPIKAYLLRKVGLQQDPFWLDPFWVFSHLLELQKRFQYRATFFFMAGGTSRFDNYYSLRNRKIEELVRMLKENGNEVALHSSFNSYDNMGLLENEKALLEEVLNSDIHGIRQHWLRWENPITWQLHNRLGITYDATLGFPKIEGFRCGTCTPFQVFDLIESKTRPFWELPLVVMDQTLYEYRNFTPEEAQCRVLQLIDRVKKHNGVFTLLWHNTSFDSETLPGWTQVFEKIVEHLRNLDAYSDTMLQVIREWEAFALPKGR